MAKANKHPLDTMSITVLLVMALFGGIVGYYVGRASFATPFRDVTTMMDTMGKMMEQRGIRYGDKELRDNGKIIMEKIGSINTMMKGY